MKIHEYLNDYEHRSFLVFGLSIFITTAFFFYNLFLGISYRMIWNFSISFYYLVLLLIKINIIAHEKKWQFDSESNRHQKQIQLFYFHTRILLLMDFTLIIPIVLMIMAQRSVSVGMIPAISIAAYTTYKIVFSILNYLKTRKQNNLSLFSLKVINLMDAIVSLLTLQNTLIMVFGNTQSMMLLSTYTSALFLVFMFIMTILLIRKGQRYARS